MRVRFFRPTDEAETTRRLELERRIDAFWSTANAAIRAGRVRTLPPEVASALSAVDDRLLPELIDVAGSTPTLVITAQGRAANGALADAVVQRAPRRGPLRAARYRPQRPLDAVLAEVRTTHGLDLSSAEVRTGIARGHLLEAVVYFHGCSDGGDERALDAANLAVLGLVGEARFDDWVGAVDVAPMPRPGGLPVARSSGPSEARYPLGDLPLALDRAIKGIRDGLSDVPYHLFCERASWTMLDVEATAAEDYAAQDDLVHCVTMLPEMTKCFLSGGRFSSKRFSRQGERFVYLKVDAEPLDVQERHALRLELEDRLNYALVPGRVGCVVAAGLGLRYLYVTLALANLEAGLELACRAARSMNVTERSWLLFCDSTWSAEWLGVFEVSPPPLLPESSAEP